MTSHIDRDERTVAVENASYRLAYLVMSFGLLAVIIYRSMVRNDPTWDLIVLLFLGGAVEKVYQWRQSVLSARWVGRGLVTIIVAAVLAALVVWLRQD